MALLARGDKIGASGARRRTSKSDRGDGKRRLARKWRNQVGTIGLAQFYRSTRESFKINLLKK